MRRLSFSFNEAEVKALREACDRSAASTDDNGPVDANTPEVQRFHDAVVKLAAKFVKRLKEPQ